MTILEFLFVVAFFYYLPKVTSVSLVLTTLYTSLKFKDNPFLIILHRVFVLPAKHNVSTSLKWDIIPEYIIYSEYQMNLDFIHFGVVEFYFWLFPAVTTLWVSFSPQTEGQKYCYYICRNIFDLVNLQNLIPKI